MATGNTLHVEVVTAEQELYNGEADTLEVQGYDGQLGILPEHAPMLALLGIGPLTIKLNGAEELLFVSGGFLEVSNDHVTVLADTAEHAENIDAARAEEARQRAQDRLEQDLSNPERAELHAALARALGRLRVAEAGQSNGSRRIAARVSE